MKYVPRGPARVTLVSALVAGSIVFLSPGPASAASCNPANPFARGDFDGDYRTDAVVGVPSYDGGAGGVDARGSHTSALVITPGMLLRGGAAGSGFGTAVALTDLDSDGCADLVVGAPGEDRKGAVHLLFGSPTGFTTMDTVALAHDSHEGDAFGSALALSLRRVGSQVVHDLYVGAPGADIGGKADAGEVIRYTITRDPASKVKATFRERRHQGAGGVPDAAEAGDRFGAVLAGVEAGPPIKAPAPKNGKPGKAPQSSGGVLVGTPAEDVGPAKDAGLVTFLRTTAAGAAAASASWTQDSAGVSGAAEPGDRFGAALSFRTPYAVVGIPGEDVESAADAGSVQPFLRSASGAQSFAPTKGVITEGSPGVPGTPEPGDQFGSAVTVGIGLLCARSLDVAIGAPGKDAGPVLDAGSVSLVQLGGFTSCAPDVVTQGRGLPGTADAGDRLGTNLTVLRGRTDAGHLYTDRLVVGVPFEDVGGTADAGQVQAARGVFTVDGAARSALEFSGGALAAGYYGTVLTSSSD